MMNLLLLQSITQIVSMKSKEKARLENRELSENDKKKLNR